MGDSRSSGLPGASGIAVCRSALFGPFIVLIVLDIGVVTCSEGAGSNPVELLARLGDAGEKLDIGIGDSTSEFMSSE